MTESLDNHYLETLYEGYGQRFRMDKLLHEVRTDHQHLVIFENPVMGRVMALDGVIQTTEADEFIYHEMLTHVPILAHGAVKRVLIIGGKPVPYSLARIPQGSEVRGNLAAGGKGVAQPLSARDSEIAHALGPILQSRGLLLAGVDVIGDYVTEINVTSPTCFQEIQQQTGCDVAALFIDALEEACAGEKS